MTLTHAPSTLDAFRLDGKVAVVTGAAGLLGEHHCRALSDAGAYVVAADLDISAVEDLANDLPTESLGIPVNVTERTQVQRLCDETLDHFGRVDVLINNAAINDMFESPALAAEQSRFENYPLDMWLRSIDVNVTGVFLCAQVLGSQMAEQGGGSIVNIASTYGIVAPNQALYRTPEGEQAFYKSPAYPTTKGAVLSFTKYLAAYWGSAGVRVNALSPGGVFNGQDEHFVQSYASQTPLGRMAEPTDYRNAIVFLASDASAYMTGANLVIDGGWTAW